MLVAQDTPVIVISATQLVGVSCETRDVLGGIESDLSHLVVLNLVVDLRRRSGLMIRNVSPHSAFNNSTPESILSHRKNV
jgi:hypothetical protein